MVWKGFNSRLHYYAVRTQIRRMTFNSYLDTKKVLNYSVPRKIVGAHTTVTYTTIIDSFTQQ
jgi:hypothetical protein